ncbi:unnamed protein product [Rotaria magnacalcarata]|uniref:Uncharacterized protein n=1 Tax=Rotaria magnacalcarata TaxID=392030 RepID=A0A815E0R5_9BILA|nr:unnamed protein product [Rotaria magnacalcarata]
MNSFDLSNMLELSLNRLYERFIYWVIGKRNFIHESTSLDKKLPSLEYLYITRLLIGTRVYKYDKEALDYLQPVLQNMRANRESFQGLLNSCQNKRAEACQRRGADIIERMSVIFQNLFDTLKVLQSIESIQFDRIRKNTLEEIKTKINNVFYSNEIIEGDDDCIYPDGVDLKELIEVQIKSVKKIPLQSMKVGISAAKAAVKFFKKVLLPQSIQLFSVDMVDVKKDIVSELKVIQNPMNCFSVSDLTYNSIFHNHKRDNVDVKEILSSLEKKHFLKRGKFLKVGTRLLDSWMKILPNPANDQEIYCFRNELNKSYQIELEKYISLYESGIDHKSSLTETSESILLTQRRWIEQLRWKLGNSAIQPNSSELIMVTHSPEKQMAQTERSASFESSITFNVYNTYGSISTRLDMFQDIIHCFAHSPMDSQTTYVNINESLSASQCMNYSRIIECCDDMVVENNEHILEDNHIDIDEYIIHDCLSDLTAQVDNLIKTTDEEIADLNSNQNFSSLESSKQLTASNDSLMSEGMKMLCKRILLTDSVILSSTKLNKICKTNMIDVRKACNLLIEHGLLSLENKLLANKFTYHESYIKQLPRNKAYLVDFSLTLVKFGIVNFEAYYETLKTIDTKNGIYLTPHGLSVLRQKRYSDLKIVINEESVVEPSKESYRKLFDPSKGNKFSGKYKDVVETDQTINIESELENSITITKRQRGLTDKAKEYQEQRMQTKKKKNNQ